MCHTTHRIAAAIGLTLAFTSIVAGQDFDRIKTTSATINGTITQIAADEVQIDQNGDIKKVPVNEIESISFVGEPRELRDARAAAAAGRFTVVQESLEKINVEELTREQIQQDVAYYSALAAARLAAAGSGDAREAARQLNAFVTRNPTSFHFYEANEALGDLGVALKSWEGAQKYYAVVEKAPWPDYQLRAAVLKGRALLAQGKAEEALATFDRVLSASGADKQTAAQKLAATIGKAAALADSGKAAEGISLIQNVIQQAGPEEAELHARAYNALGYCHAKANDKKEALLAYLHVDVLYNAFPDPHAESLANLAVLWGDISKPDRAKQARDRLAELYPNSRWAKSGE